MLKQYGITHILSLGVFPNNLSKEIKHMKIVIEDTPNAKITPYLANAVEFIS